MAAQGSKPRVLSIAGTDPTGGAGMQADIKAIAAAGGYGMSAVTAIVSQNTLGVRSVFTPPIEVLEAQLEAVSSDVQIDAVKIGMLGNQATIACVEQWCRKYTPPHVVIDPVMVATSGHRLLSPDAEAALFSLLPFAQLITPNIPELAVCVGQPAATSLGGAIEQGSAFAARYDLHVLVKGGHLEGQPNNALISPDGEVALIENTRVHTSNTHGTGCSLSSAIATRLGAGATPLQAATWATTWLHGALAAADALKVGHGNGPVDHFHHLPSTACS